MFWMCAYPLQGEVGGGWALEFSSFLGPVKWHLADRRVPFEASLNQWRKKSDPELDPDPDQLVRGTDPGIRIRIV
jgi:hypothetical protein